jgi:hypothetical protein
VHGVQAGYIGQLEDLFVVEERSECFQHRVGNAAVLQRQAA